jgi:hypothetical protein
MTPCHPRTGGSDVHGIPCYTCLRIEVGSLREMVVSNLNITLSLPEEDRCHLRALGRRLDRGATGPGVRGIAALAAPDPRRQRPHQLRLR